MFVFIIRLKIAFWSEVRFSPIDFSNANKWIYQITKPCKLIKKMLINGNINQINIFTLKLIYMDSIINVSKKLGLFLIYTNKIVSMQ